MIFYSCSPLEVKPGSLDSKDSLGSRIQSAKNLPFVTILVTILVTSTAFLSLESARGTSEVLVKSSPCLC